MDNESPLSYILGAVLLAVVAGGSIYIAKLREDNAELRRQLEAKAATQPAPRAAVPAGAAAAAPPASSGKDRTISADDRKLMVAKLSGSSNPVWFATQAGNAEAAAFRTAIQGIFEEAGWQIKGNSLLTFPVKPGVYIFAAEDNAPSYITQVSDAFGVLNISPTLGTGYREFYKAKKAENPNWNGFDLAADQAYVIVIGPKP